MVLAKAEVEQPLRFPGQYFDNETGLHYNYFRTYDPAVGRYTQSDPIGLDGGVNRWGYGLQQPIGNVDPTGENAILAAAIAVIGPLFYGDFVETCINAGNDYFKEHGVLCPLPSRLKGQCIKRYAFWVDVATLPLSKKGGPTGDILI